MKSWEVCEYGGPVAAQLNCARPRVSTRASQAWARSSKRLTPAVFKREFKMRKAFSWLQAGHTIGDLYKEHGCLDVTSPPSCVVQQAQPPALSQGWPYQADRTWPNASPFPDRAERFPNKSEKELTKRKTSSHCGADLCVGQGTSVPRLVRQHQHFPSPLQNFTCGIAARHVPSS